MASKAAGAHATKPDGPVQTTTLLVQLEALGADDMIRSELKKKGFSITHQAMVYLSIEAAREFTSNICNPYSGLYPSTHSTASGSLRTNPNETSSSRPPSAAASRNVIDTSKKAPTEPIDDIMEGLTQGPLLLLGLEKVQAVSELIELVGPFDPDAWPNAPTTLRAKYGKGRAQVGVRCSNHELTASKELAFLLNHTHALGPVSSSRTRPNASSIKSAQVDLDQLLNFLFPPHMQHPHSTGRLFVFGLYGPLDINAQLRSGEKGLHVITDFELNTMSNRMEREDILAVYDMCSLSQEDEEEVLRHVDGVLKTFPRYSKRDVETLFKQLPRDTEGKLSFHDMQAAIMKERCRRVLCMKQRIDPVLAPPILNAYRHTIRRLTKTKYEIAPATMFLKDLGFTGAENATLVSQLLSNHSFRICHLDDGNSPSLTQNVRLLREDIYNPNDTRPAWSTQTKTKPTLKAK